MRNSTSFKHGAWLVALLSALALAGCDITSDSARIMRGGNAGSQAAAAQTTAQEDAGPGGHSD